MAKKKTAPRRVPRSASPRTYGDGLPSRATQEALGTLPAGGRPVAEPAAQGARSARPPLVTSVRGGARSQASLAQEYRYVPGDLKRLGIVAGVTFAAMIVLGIVLPLLGI